MEKAFKENIKNVIDQLTNPKTEASIHCTGDTNSINIIKNELRKVRELRIENATLRWMRVEPAVVRDKEFFQILRVAISGRNNSWYQFKRINVFIFFPDGYPKEKPVIFFEDLTDPKGKDHVFEHVNVFRSGKLCLEAIQKNYVPSMTLADILMALERCIYEDNVDSPANGSFSTTKKTNPDLYAKKLNEQSEMLEWLAESQIPKQDEEDDFF